MIIRDEYGNVIYDESLVEYERLNIDLVTQLSNNDASTQLVSQNIPNFDEELPQGSHNISNVDKQLPLLDDSYLDINTNTNATNQTALIESPQAKKTHQNVSLNVGRPPKASGATPVKRRPPQHRAPSVQEMIHQAMHSGDLEAIKKIISENNSNTIDGSESKIISNVSLRQLIEKLCKNPQDTQSEEIFYLLLEAGGDLTECDKDGRTPLYGSDKHFPLTKKLWEKRNTLSEKAKTSVMRGCFQVLSKKWMLDFFWNTSTKIEDFEELFKSATPAEQEKFLMLNLQGYNKTALQILCENGELLDPDTDRSKALLRRACFLLDYATPKVLTEVNPIWKHSFLTYALFVKQTHLINYAKICQNQSLLKTISEVEQEGGYSSEDSTFDFTRFPEIHRNYLIRSITVLNNTLLTTVENYKRAQSGSSALTSHLSQVEQYLNASQEYLKDPPKLDSDYLNKWKEAFYANTSFMLSSSGSNQSTTVTCIVQKRGSSSALPQQGIDETVVQKQKLG